MAGRTNRTERGVSPTGAQRVDRRQTGAGGERRSFERCRAGIRVGIDSSAATRADLLDPVQVPRRMHAFEIGPFSGTRFERGERLSEIGPANALEHRVETRRTLRMAGAGKMFEVNRMGCEQHGHTVGRYLAAVGSGLPFAP